MTAAGPYRVPAARVPAHPGTILREEFLVRGLDLPTLAKRMGMREHHLENIVSGQVDITEISAWLLADALGTTPLFWVNLQKSHDAGRRAARR